MLKDISLELGPVILSGFELPEEILFGEVQKVVTHDIPGGYRTFDVLGNFSSDIRWKGIFSGPAASTRFQLLEQILAQGIAIPLIWGSFTYSVVIKSLCANFHNLGWIPYEIVLSVLQDNTQILNAPPSSLSVDAPLDVGMATTFGSAGGISLQNLSEAIAAAGSTILDTSAYNSASQATGEAISLVSSSFAVADAIVGGFSQTGINSAADIATLTDAAGNQAALNWANAFLGRLQSNMSRAGT